VLNHQEKEEL
jgi:Ca2+-binding EF-hand superfamily protein